MSSVLINVTGRVTRSEITSTSPVSSVMLDRIDDYRATLHAHSGPLMVFIEWRPTPERNVQILNDTGDLYRYFDCTEAAEFLYSCVRRAVEQDLPHEIDYLAATTKRFVES
jgi:hypothetical protein